MTSYFNQNIMRRLRGRWFKKAIFCLHVGLMLLHVLFGIYVYKLCLQTLNAGAKIFNFFPSL